MLYAQVNAEGLNEGVLEMDERAAAAHPLPLGWKLVRVAQAEHSALGFLGHAARHDPISRAWHRLPEPHVRRLDRRGGMDAIQVLAQAGERGHHLTALQTSGQMRCLRECPPESLPEIPPPARRVPIPTTELMPGLEVREMTVQDAELFATHAVASGRYDGTEEHIRALVDTWIDSPLCWPLATAWRGEALQLECYHFEPAEPDMVRAGLTVHLNRERPAWFWRECERPVFEALAAHGVVRVISRTRSDRADWIETLKATYAAREIAGYFAPNHTALAFDVDRALSLATGWPARRTAAGWSWEQRGVRVVEVTSPEDIEAARQQLHAAWGPHQRKALVLRMLDAWFELDAGTVLMAFVDGAPRHVRIVRPRTATVGSIGVLTPFWDEPSQAQIVAALNDWMRAVGYDIATGFVPLAQWENAKVMRHADVASWQVRRIHTQFAEPFVEIERPVRP